MATEPLAMTTEAIALTEKKMDMTLDDIIKMSKKPSAKAKKPRVPNKKGGFSGLTRDNFRVQNFMESKSSLRQGALAIRRSQFQANHFPTTNDVAKKVNVITVPRRGFNQRRIMNRNNLRVVGPAVQKEVASEGAFTGGKVVGQQKRRPRTLDSLFANLKEQRTHQQQMPSGNSRPRHSQRRQEQQLSRGRGGGGIRAANGRATNRYAR